MSALPVVMKSWLQMLISNVAFKFHLLDYMYFTGFSLDRKPCIRPGYVYNWSTI